MRIAMISTPFLAVPPRDYGGTELVVYELVEGLIDQGHEVTLFATGDSRTRAKLSSLYFERQWPPNPLSEASHLSWAFSRIRPDEFDLVHAHSAVALAMNRLAAGIPIVYTLHHHQVDQFSAPELIEEGVTGFLVKSREEMSEVDPAGRASGFI